MVRTIIVFMTVLVMLAANASTPNVQAQGGASPAAAGGEQIQVPYPNPAGLGYYEYLPIGYETGTRFPLVMFFHGIGERGNGNTELHWVLKHGPPKLIAAGRDFEAIVISPQLFKSQGSWSTSITIPFVDYILSHYKVDLDRVYITGLSLGGGGAWMYAKSRPNTVAAVVPICGYEPNSAGYEVLRGKPIWTFHAVGDTVVPINHTINILKVITGVDPQPVQAGQTGYFNGTSWTWRPGESGPQANENPIFTVYQISPPSDPHNAWTPAYNNDQMWDWLFLQRRQNNTLVFQQDFQSATTVPPYVNSTNPNIGQFNDISAEATGGTWSINQGRLQIARTGSGTADNDAGITRHTDFVGPPLLLHIVFDLGVSNWSNSPFQSNAMTLSIGKIATVTDYGNGEVAVDTFQTLSVNGKGAGQYVFATAGVESAILASNGAMHRVSLFLNKSNTAASYKAPNGTARTLRASGVALWVDANLVVDTNATNGSSSSLTDLRVRFTTSANGTWALDNMVIRNAFPQ